MDGLQLLRRPIRDQAEGSPWRGSSRRLTLARIRPKARRGEGQRSGVRDQGSRSTCRHSGKDLGRPALQWAEPSNLLQIGELLHQLFHAVTVEQDSELGVFAVALAHENGALAVFAVADALAFLQAGGACRLADLHG